MKPQKLEQVELQEYKPVLYAVVYLHLEAYGIISLACLSDQSTTLQLGFCA